MLSPPGPIAEFLEGVLRRRKNAEIALKRRSKGILNIVVTHRTFPLEVYDVCLRDRKGEQDPIVLEGKFPLTHLQKNVYVCYFDVPNGPPLMVRVIYSNGWVMISTPGRSWSIGCQVGRIKT